jgi:hypothetical protein
VKLSPAQLHGKAWKKLEWKKLEWRTRQRPNGRRHVRGHGYGVVIGEALIGTLSLNLLKLKNGLDNGVHFKSQKTVPIENV